MGYKVNLNQFRAFHAVNKFKSFKLAAQHLNVSTSAVSMQLRALETELGFKLFSKKTGIIELTKKAKALYPISNDIFNLTDLLQKKIDSFDKSHNISIALYITPALLLCPIISRYFDENLPNLEIDYIHGDKDKCIELLKNMDVDIIIQAGKYQDDDIISQEFLKFELPYIVSKKNPILQKNEPVSLEELRELVTLVPPLNSAFAQHLYTFLGENDIPLPRNKYIMDSSLFTKFIKNTSYGAFINSLEVQEELERGEIAILELEKNPAPTSFYLGYLQSSYDDPNIRKALQHFENLEAFYAHIF